MDRFYVDKIPMITAVSLKRLMGGEVKTAG
jgi:hypothetical protein